MQRRRWHFKLAISVWNALVAFIIEWLCRPADRQANDALHPLAGLCFTGLHWAILPVSPRYTTSFTGFRWAVTAPFWHQLHIWMQDESDFGAIPHHVARSILIRASPAATRSCKCIFYIFISLKPARWSSCLEFHAFQSNPPANNWHFF